jgi:hypothetical protein
MTCHAKRATPTVARGAASIAHAASIMLLAAGCHGKHRALARRTPAPLAASASVPNAEASDAAPADWAVNGPVWRFVVEWNSALDHHDAKALQALYADRLSYYGQRRSKAEVIRAKQAAFESEPDLHQQIPGFIDINLGIGDYFRARFWKLSGKPDQLNGTNAKLVIERGDGGPLQIVEEADDDASEKQNSLCDWTAADVVNALPAVKQSVAKAFARADASNGKLRFGGIGPQDLSAPDGFFVSMGLHSDERFETVVLYGVDREGLLTVQIEWENSVAVPPAALRKVAQACRR